MLCRTPRRQTRTVSLPSCCQLGEKKVRELEKFSQSALSNDQKVGFLRQLANDDMEQFLSHLSATSGQTYETLRVHAESQIAQKRTAQSYHQGKTSDKMNNASKTDDQETRQE